VDTVIKLAFFILMLGGLIFFHELGHFLMATGLGIRVQEFGLGLPPRLLKLGEWRGTAFTLNWIPLGGFVRPVGEFDPAVADGLAASAAWKRAAVFAAGAAPRAVAELDARLRQWGNPYRDVEPVASTGTAPAALFAGAAAQHLRPQTLAAARKLLDALGIAHVPVAAGLSSVYLPFALGLRETALTLAKAALQEIVASRCARLIVLTPEDRRAFSDALSELGLHLPDGVELVELMALLVEGVEAGRLAFRRTDLSLTYHDPAHTPHFPGRAAQARRVLSALTTQPLREMFWREGRAAPGGAVGGLEFTHPALAERMTRDRLAEAAATGAHMLVTEDPAALAHLERFADGAGIKVAGLFEMIAEQMT